LTDEKRKTPPPPVLVLLQTKPLIYLKIIVVATYMVSSGFFSVYAMAVDTLFLCFLEDLETNDGSAEKPYFMSKNLMKVLGKTSEKEKQSKCRCF